MLAPAAAVLASVALLAPALPAPPVQVVPQLGHTQPVVDVAFAPGGAWVATSASDGAVKLWTGGGQLLRTLHVSGAGSRPRIAISPDGEAIAVTLSHGVEVWSPRGKRLASARMDAHEVGAVAWDPDGSGFVACALMARRAHCQLFDANARPLAMLEVPAGLGGTFGKTVGAAIAPGGGPIYAAAGRSVVKWSRRGEVLGRFEAGPEMVAALALSPDGKRLATATRGNTTEIDMPGAGRLPPRTRLWDPDGVKIADVPTHATDTLFFSADGEWVVSGGEADGKVVILDRDGHLVKRLAVGGTGSLSPAHLGIAPDRSRLVVADERFKPVVLRAIDLEGQVLTRFGTGTAGVGGVALDPSGSVIVSAGYDGQIRLWTLDGRLVRRFRGADESPAVLAVDPGGRFLVTGTEQLEARSARGDVLGRARMPRGVYARCVAFAPDGKTFWVGDSRGAVTAVPLAGGGDRVTSLFRKNEDVTAVAVSASGDAIVVGGPSNKFRILDGRGAVKVSYDPPKDAPDPSAVQGLAFTPDGSELVVASGSQGRQLAVFDRAGRLLRQADTGSRFRSGAMALSPSGRLAAVSVYEAIGIYDVATLQRRALLRGHTGDVNTLAFTADERHLVSGAGDGTVRVWDVASGASFALLARGDEWVIFTDDGYFDASRRGAELVTLVEGMEAFGVDQVAVRFNRPDLIYQRVGVGSPEHIEHLRFQHEDRLRRANVRGEAGGVEAPRVRITAQRQDGDVLELGLTIEDAGRGLRAVQVEVNGVPLHPGLGRPLDGGRRAELVERVTLGQGRSRVEVTASNDVGFVSRRAGVVVERPAGKPGVLWFVGLGVSRYRDPRLDLRFAAKDVSALAAALRKTRGQYRDVKTLELTDARATRAALEEIRAFLAATAVDDTVILLASGHGARTPDAQATFRFVTHEADPSDLAGTTVSLDELEGLLGGVAARRRLLLVDACQSGELDPEAIAAAEERAGAGGLAARVTPGAVGGAARPRSYLYVRDRFVYERLDRRTGAAVFASSLGSEVSLESPALGNGVFTAALLRALGAPAADANRDGWLSLDEVEGAVKAAVVQATGGLQHPTVERDNPLQELRLPRVR